MRRLLLALPFALLPLSMAHAADDHVQEHGSLGAHEHGVGRLDIALDGKALEFELDSPAMNIVGFEHEATTDEDKAKLMAAREVLLKSQALFNLPEVARCAVASQRLESPLFGDKADADHDDDENAKGAEHHHEHSEIHAHYQFICDNASALNTFDLTQIFKSFPATQKIQVQLVSPRGQFGTEATPAKPKVKF